ncbi:hypothetical protein B0T26DRAFT_874064 [Lasiosphaeria miniovina]|uniref:Uncharacterized protein n=1 Tax=Lasiosphaeria miniovina TaxID=1954250 RepID=A0AA40AE03_9PEZI|nr:uncharacterized protein B0T26DRAFT_874064 [Lasiosphaeria miniovina]KAK0714106.1 hypothetical protein B0T26DRAFT_874064 [Lasiosphaeria miniovina]
MTGPVVAPVTDPAAAAPEVAPVTESTTVPAVVPIAELATAAVPGLEVAPKPHPAHHRHFTEYEINQHRIEEKRLRIHEARLSDLNLGSSRAETLEPETTTPPGPSPINTLSINDFNFPIGVVQPTLPESFHFEHRDTGDTASLVSTPFEENPTMTKINQVGYFNPDVEVAGDEPLATVGSDIHYKDVNLFFDSVMEHANVPARRDILRRDLAQLLKGSAQLWYIETLSDLDRRFMKENLSNWKARMTRRFAMTKTEAGDKLLKCTYTSENCKSGVPFRSYAAEKMRYCKAMGFTDITNVMTFIYAGIEPSIQQLIHEPDSSMTIDEYLASVEEKTKASARVLNGTALPQKIDDFRGTPPTIIPRNRQLLVGPAYNVDDLDSAYYFNDRPR